MKKIIYCLIFLSMAQPQAKSIDLMLFKVKQFYDIHCSDLSEIEFDEVKYCHYTPKQRYEEKHIIFFHGIGGSETKFSERTDLLGILEYIIDNSRSLPSLTTLSTGKFHLISPFKGKVSIRDMGDDIIPYIERAYVKHHVAERVMMGESMGGFNSMQIFSRYQFDYDKAVFLCPALSPLNPFSPVQFIKDFVKITTAKFYRIFIAISLARFFYPKLSYWREESPYFYVKNLAYSELNLDAQIYLYGADNDSYGFQHGAQQFYDMARKRSMNIVYEEVHANHCEIDANKVGRFILK